MKQYLHTQRGSVMVSALITVVFLTIVISGLLPMVSTQVSLSSKNNDTIEAQYAAEAGAKRAIVGIRKKRTDWKWTIGNMQNAFVDGTTKHYITSIRPLIADGAFPATNTTYTITSDGYVGNVHKRVVVTFRKSNGPFNYAAFSQGNMLINQPRINGDIYSNGHITVNSSTINTVTGTAYCKENDYTIYTPAAIGKGFKVPDPTETLDLSQLIKPMPNITKIGTDLQTFTNNKSGDFTLPGGSYFYDSGGSAYGMYNQSYNIASGNSVIIYVNGDFNIGKNITGGNITIYAKGNITFNGGSVQASPGGTVNIYANNVLTLNSGSSITGRTVTALANNASNQYYAIAFNGGSINNTLSNSLSKIYASGNVALNDTSVIAGQGSGMLVATGEVSLNGGNAPQTLIVAGGNVNGNSGSSVAGIYSNGTINMNGATITYNDSLKEILELSSNGSSTPFIVSWSNQ